MATKEEHMSTPSAHKTVKKTDEKALSIGINTDGRAATAQALSGFLASTYTLYMKTLYYHWNVTGPMFHSLHEMFEVQYEALHEAGDEIAERVRALGHKTPGTYRAFAELSKVKEDAELPADAMQMVKNLLADNEACSVHARETLAVAEENGDEVTVDILVARMAAHDETSWMLRATAE